MFIPEHFTQGGIPEATAEDPRKFVFGFGRRACPGRLFADDNLWLAIANLVAVFDSERHTMTGAMKLPLW